MDDAEITSAKAEARKRAAADRDALEPTRAIENALAIADRVDELGDPSGMVVSGYWPIRSEIDPRPLLFALRERGARTALPVVLDGSLIFRELGRNTELQPAGFGTYGPGPEADVLQPDWVLLPLLAFDRQGNRLGYGAGHYDRAIARMHREAHAPRLIGLAHSVQERDALPVGPYDVPLHGTLCEDGLRATSVK